MTTPDLGTWLKSHRDSDATLTLDHTAVKTLHDELQRLRQSNDRMRKQNSKIRKRVARLKAGEPDPE